MSLIPTIDFSSFLVGDEDISAEVAAVGLTYDQKKVCDSINQACRDHGFVRLVGAGIDANSAFAAAKDLFGLPDEAKQRIKRIDPQSNMGYSPFASESLNVRRPPELKKAMNVRFPPFHRNIWEGCPDSFREAVEAFLPQLQKLCHAYLKACALALDLPVDFFAKTLTNMDLCTVRFLHCPPSDFHETPLDTNNNDAALLQLRVGEHTDFGAVTFLFYDDTSEGLQIKPVDGGDACSASSAGQVWQSINAPSILVNTGGLMARWTNDEWRATAHRVVVESAEAAAKHRYSIAFFVDPDADVNVQVHESFCRNDDGKPCRYEPINSLDYLMMKLNEAQLRTSSFP
jgi:isopenicillin N synthase-like dioxygenase